MTKESTEELKAWMREMLSVPSATTIAVEPNVYRSIRIFELRNKMDRRRLKREMRRALEGKPARHRSILSDQNLNRI